MSLRRFRFLHSASRSGRNALVAAFGVRVFSGMDDHLYTMVIPAVSAALHLSSKRAVPPHFQSPGQHGVWRHSIRRARRPSGTQVGARNLSGLHFTGSGCLFTGNELCPARSLSRADRPRNWGRVGTAQRRSWQRPGDQSIVPKPSASSRAVSPLAMVSPLSSGQLSCPCSDGEGCSLRPLSPRYFQSGHSGMRMNHRSGCVLKPPKVRPSIYPSRTSTSAGNQLNLATPAPESPAILSSALRSHG